VLGDVACCGAGGAAQAVAVLVVEEAGEEGEEEGEEGEGVGVRGGCRSGFWEVWCLGAYMAVGCL